MICPVNPHAQLSLSASPESAPDSHSKKLQRSLALPPARSAIMKAVQAFQRQRCSSGFAIFSTSHPAICSSANEPPNKNPRKARREATFRGFYFGATDPIRTDDLLITSELLYRLSHSSTLHLLQRVIFYHKSRELSRLIRNFIRAHLFLLFCKHTAQLADSKATACKYQQRAVRREAAHGRDLPA